MAVAQGAYQKYMNASVMTASPERLLIMLYDGLIQKIQRSKLAISESRLSDAHENLVKSQDIVLELRDTLNMEYEISHALAALYDWFYRQLVTANVKKSIEPLEDILPRIEELRDAWVQAAMIIKSEGATNMRE